MTHHDGRRRPEGDEHLRDARSRAALVHALLIFVSSALSSNEMVGLRDARSLTLVFTRKALQRRRRRRPRSRCWRRVVAASRSSSSSSWSRRSSRYVDRHRPRHRGRAACSRDSSPSSATPAGQLWKDGIEAEDAALRPAASACSRCRASRARSRRSSRAACRSSRRWRSCGTSSTTRALEDRRGGDRLSIREGESIAGPLKRSKEFPPIVVAHDRGRREVRSARDRCSRTSRAPYDSQVETRVQAMTSLLEPLIIVFMGGGSRVHRVLDPHAAHPDERLRELTE